MNRTKKRIARKAPQKQSQKVDRDIGQSPEQNARRGSIRNRKAPLAAQSTSMLDRMPVEIRREMLKYLLLNPDLGTVSCIHRDEGWGSKIKYELQPAILRVCKKLYGQNQFFIECVPSAWGHLLHHCALTRFYEIEIPEQFHSASELATNRLRAVPGVKRIKQWKVLIDPMSPGTRNIVINFCRSICHQRIKSMEIMIANWDCLEYFSLFGEILKDSAEAKELQIKKLQHVLSPFENLRCSGEFVIRGADPEEVPDFVFLGDGRGQEFYMQTLEPLWPNNAPPERVSLPEMTYLPHLINLVQGDSEVELFHEMFYAFLNYSQAFERLDEFPNHMTIKSYHSPYLAVSPFHGTHPVESALLKAFRMQINEEAGAQDISKLKEFRSIAIKFLERQYQRIQQAADDLIRFVKDQKISGGMLDPAQSPTFESHPGAPSKGLVLLKNYAESFHRELTMETKDAMCRLNGQYEKRFELLPREIAIKQCTNAYRNADVEGFVENFKLAIDDMDTQYLAIRNARKRLFEWDLKGPGYIAEVDVEPLRCDERIAWDKVEPDMDAKKAEIVGRGGRRSCRKSLRLGPYREE
ncbi:hypothetical protein EAE96_008285 [Botrytis aclada]|nr:hypothetical protein EAE96_008285 [Botrytis aclada]